jgi:hypothetical protein
MLLDVMGASIQYPHLGLHCGEQPTGADGDADEGDEGEQQPRLHLGPLRVGLLFDHLAPGAP